MSLFGKRGGITAARRRLEADIPFARFFLRCHFNGVVSLHVIFGVFSNTIML
jgi:hypothetical protein